MVISKARLRDGGEYTCTITSEGEEYYHAKKKINITVGGESSKVFQSSHNSVAVYSNRM